MPHSPKCALKPFSRVQVCLLKVLGLCKSMLGGFLQNGGHNALPLYMFAGYLEHLSSQFWISSSGIGESPQAFFSPNQQTQMLESNNQWEQARMS
jgi:hypothetical protein